MENQENEKLSALYREVLKEEMGEFSLEQEKREFIQANFSERTPSIFSGWSWMPVGAMALALLFFVTSIEPPVVTSLNPASQIRVAKVVETRHDVTRHEPLSLKDQLVHVKKVSSDVGATMVYQREHHNIPMTVVWVFPG